MSESDKLKHEVEAHFEREAKKAKRAAKKKPLPPDYYEEDWGMGRALECDELWDESQE